VTAENGPVIRLEMSDPELLERAALDAAAGLLIGAVATLVEAGHKPHVAFRLACYFVLAERYGREFVREEFGISARLEREWRATVRRAAESLGDDAEERLGALAQRAGVAQYLRSGGVS